MDFARTYTDPSARKLRRHLRAHRPRPRHSLWSPYRRADSSNNFSILSDSDSDSNFWSHRFRRPDTFPRYPTRQAGEQGMNWLSSWFSVDLLDFLKERKQRRQAQKEKKVDQGRSPRLFVVDPPDHIDSHPLPRRSTIKRTRSVLERMDKPFPSQQRPRQTRAEIHSRPLETEPIRPSRPPRVRTPITEREPPRQGRRVSPFPPVEVHQAYPSTERRPPTNRPSPERIQVVEHTSLPRATERQRTTLGNSRVGREQRRHLATSVPAQRSRGSLRDLGRPVVIHRSPRPPPRDRDVAVEFRSPRIDIEERWPRVIRDGRSNLSSSANRVIREAQPRPAAAVRFAEPFPARGPGSRPPTRTRRRVRDEEVIWRRRD